MTETHAESGRSLALNPYNHAESVALFRAGVIGQLAARELSRGELAEALRALSKARFRAPGSDHTRQFGVSTLERWYYEYRDEGLEGLKPKARNDRGRGRGLEPELLALLCDIRRENPSASVSLILRTLACEGRIDPTAVSASTLRRVFVERGLDKVPIRDGTGSKIRLRWQAERPMALWHGDVCHGPALRIGKVAKALRIHALLDDASRYIPAIDVFHTEREDDMLGLMVGAIRSHGAPDGMYLDNGPTYIGHTLKIACERLGITLLHAKPYDAPARGKMERFWGTLRGGCLDFLGTLSSLEEVRARLWAFVQQHYHTVSHAGLLGRSPKAVWEQRDTQLEPSDRIDEGRLRKALTVIEPRRVRRDTTVNVEGVVYELQAGFLAGRIVKVARCLVDPIEPPWVEFEGKRLALHRVDAIANGHKTRSPRRPATSNESPRPKPHFDPAGALLAKAKKNGAP